MTSQAELDALACAVLPRQGHWSDEAYLRLTDQCSRLVEFTDGYVEQLPMPTSSHQAVLLFLYRLFDAYLRPRGGVAMVSPLRMRIREGKYREPDVLALRSRADDRYQDRYWLGADIVIEVVSPDNPSRDLVEKRSDYGEAGIPEYWVADPRNATMTVLAFSDGDYVEDGVFGRGDLATSAHLDGFSVDVGETFDAVQRDAPRPTRPVARPRKR